MNTLSARNETGSLKSLVTAARRVVLIAAVSALAAPVPALAVGYTVEHAFTNSSLTPDGANSVSSLTKVGNCLYGTTVYGGQNGLGTVFRRCGNAQVVIYSFGNNGPQDGEYPHAALTWDPHTNLLYGTTLEGGSASCSDFASCGTVFSITTTGTETVVWSFQGGTDGYAPYAGLTYNPSNYLLYGTTTDGGNPNSVCSTTYSQCGTVYQIDPASNPPETVLYSFAGSASNDGANPAAAPILDTSGNLYGTTGEGGNAAVNCTDLQYGCGTVWKLTPGSATDSVW